MRLMGEALRHLWQAPETHANESLLAFMLMHNNGARNTALQAILHDSKASRLIYRAVCGYDAAESVVPNAEGGTHKIMEWLEQVLPAALHQADADDGDAEIYE